MCAFQRGISFEVERLELNSRSNFAQFKRTLKANKLKNKQNI